MVESSRINSQNVGNIEENCDIEMLYDGEEAEGFDVSNGTEWIYPTNYPIRTYQKKIVSNALFKNTLVCLPTGLGKTFIAAVVMYNYHRWYPKHLVVFMAHSKPLVTQQVNACCNIMGISPSLIGELNGNMQHANRKKQWESKKIFFLTPQVFNNDLARGNVKAESIRCIVIDEAHKALGNQAYCQVIRSIKPFNTNFRVLALSATPGDDMNMVKEVIQNLMISHLELHNEDDPDIKPYLHEKKIETIIVKLDEKILHIKEMFFKAVDKYIKPLSKHKLIPQSYSSINSFTLVLRQRQFIQESNIGPELRGLMLSNFSIAIPLFHALEELVIHGMRSFVTKIKNLRTGDGSTNKAYHRLANDDDIKSLIDHIENILGPDPCVSFDAETSITRIFDEIDSIEQTSSLAYSHPKFAIMEKIIKEHFEKHKDSTRVIVFCKSRYCTGEICNFLARFKPVIKPMIFIGQSQSSGGIVTKGFNQAAQLTVIKKFRDGVYNTLIATCVAEEGLDIGEVDLIINFDSGKNSNTQVQRSGRTGRKRDGRVVNLVTEGKEHQNYNLSVYKGKKMSKKLVSVGTNLPFYLGSPRLIPKGVQPVCQEMYFSVKKNIEEQPKERKRKSKGQKNSMNEEGAQPSKRVKETASDKKTGSSLWTMIADEKSDKSENKVEEQNLNEEIAEVNFGGVNIDHSEDPLNNKVKIVDEEHDKSVGILYNDDVEETDDKLWESLSDDELQGEERSLVVEFLRKNNTMIKPKNNFRDLVNLKKINKYCKLLGESNTGLVSKMISVQNYKLSENDKKCLKSEKLDVETLVACFNKLRVKILTEKDGGKGNVKATERKSPRMDVAFDVDPDEFFPPFEEFIPQMMSSTPVRSNKENIMPPSVENSSVTESNFQLWDENDFFNLKENVSPERNGNLTDKGLDSSCKSRDFNMISITQALDFVNNTELRESKNEGEREKGKKKDVPESSSSPVFFCSQRPRTRNKFIPNSPILTQRCNSKGRSRKCLTFKDELKPVGKAIQNFTFEDVDNSDLFAEAEIALHNQVQELEENLNEIDKKTMDTEKKETDAEVLVLTISSSASEGTEEYDMEKMNFDVNSTPAGLLKPTNKDRLENQNSKEFTNSPQKCRAYNSKMVNCNDDNCNEGKANDESRWSRLDSSDFIKDNTNETKPIMESTPIRSGPKMAVVRPMGFENMPFCNNFASKAGRNESEPVLKQEPQSFACNFSLFDDDDFNDDCFTIEQSEKTEKSKTSEKSSGKVDFEENDGSNDSDIFNRDSKFSNLKPLLIPNEKVDCDAELFNCMLDDGDLSEGALEAIKAVEMYEKDVEIAKKAELKGLESDDSDEFFFPKRRRTKVNNTDNDLPTTNQKKNVQKKKVKDKVHDPISEFLEREAEVSDTMSSDEENTTGLDEYDSSFVDEREVFSQAQDVDMTAKYLQWAKSPVERPGAFKIPNRKITNELNVFSQIGSEGESEYENDSFCVSDEKNETEVNEISELDVAEVILQDKKKRKRVKAETLASIRKKKKFRRILLIESDSSGGDIGSGAGGEVVPESNPHKSEISCIQELFSSPFPIEKNVAGPTTTETNKPAKEVIFVASRQIASAPEITTCLRAKWEASIHVRSAPEADYIVSWRVGINRISLSDVANGSSTVKGCLMEMVKKLSTNFRQPVLIVEDDKNKGLPITVGSGSLMWAKHSMKTLIKILRNNVKIVFSGNKDETARIIVNICKQENMKGHFIQLTGDLLPETEKKMKFYCSLPGVNVANAFRMASKFLTLSSFMNRCDSVHNIMHEMGLTKEAATSVYQVLFITPS